MPGIGRVGIEAAAVQVENLVAQHVAHGPQLAPIAIALAQQARGAVVPAVGEAGEIERNHLEAVEIFGDLLHRVIGLQLDTEAAIAARQPVARLPPVRKRDDDVGIAETVHRFAVDEAPVILDDFGSLNDLHKPAP